jgi:hypothetical protein
VKSEALLVLLRSRFTWILLAAAGLGLGAYLLHEDNRLRAIASTYRKTTCVVQTAEVTYELRRSGRRGRIQTRVFFPEITYAYTVDGREYVGDRYEPTDRSMDAAEAEQVVSRYTPGRQQACWYDPANPGQAVLTLQYDTRHLYGMAAAALLLLFGGVAGWAFLEFLLPRLTTPPPPTPAANELEIPAWSALGRLQRKP